MKYQLVALFDHESSIRIEDIQKNICKKYKVPNKNTPVMHIPLTTIVNPDIDKLETIILKVLKPYKEFKVRINNGVYVNAENKQVSVSIDEKGYVSRISRNIFELLTLHGINMEAMRSPHSDLFIPMGGISGPIKKACSQNVIPINSSLNSEDALNYGKINRLELWKVPTNKRDFSPSKKFSKKDLPVKTFLLREY